MLGVPEAVRPGPRGHRHGRAVGDERTRGLGYLALQLALRPRGAYQEAVEAAAQARLRLEAARRGAALRCLDVQLGLTYCTGGNFTAAVGGQRALRGLGPGERWLHGYVASSVRARASTGSPGGRPECADAAGEALRALQDLGDPVGEAYALEVLGWLAADDGRFSAPPGCSGRRRRAGSGRAAGSAATPSWRAPRAVRGRRPPLGPGRCAELHAGGAGTPIELRSSRWRWRATTRCRACPRPSLGCRTGSAAGPRPAERAHQPRAGDRRAGRPRSVQPGDRRPPVHLQADRGRARQPHLRQAPDLLAGAADDLGARPGVRAPVRRAISRRHA